MADDDHKHDRKLFDKMILVLGVLAFVAMAMIFLARGPSRNIAQEEPAAQAMLEERIKPVGSVAVAGEDAAEPGSETTAEATAPSGEQIYNSACIACHGAGIAGAPKFGDAAVWQPRLAQGTDTLYDHAINGFQGSGGLMPAKGGRPDLSDESVQAAVDFMVAGSQ